MLSITTEAYLVKKAYDEYTAARKASLAVDLADEEAFEDALDDEMEKLDALAEAVESFTNGQITKGEAIRMADTAKFANLMSRVASIA